MNIHNENDLPALQEALNKLGLTYTVNDPIAYSFSDAGIKSFEKTKSDFLNGKTTARNWDEIEKDLDNACNLASLRGLNPS